MQLESTFSADPAPRLPLFNILWAWVAAAVALVVWSLIQAGVFNGQTLINSGGWTLALRFAQAALNPRLSLEFLTLTLNASLTTLAFALCGTSLSLLIGMIGGVLSSEVWWQRHHPQFRARCMWTAGGAIRRSTNDLGIIFVNILVNPLAAIHCHSIWSDHCQCFGDLDETPRALSHCSTVALTTGFYSILPQAASGCVLYILSFNVRLICRLWVIGRAFSYSG